MRVHQKTKRTTVVRRVRKKKTVKNGKRRVTVVRRRKKIVKKKRKTRRKCSIKKASRLSQHFLFLQRLFTTGDLKLQRTLIKKASKAEILALTEFVYNILRQNIPLTSDQKRALCQHKKDLLMITNRGVPCEKKRKLFLKSQQEGGIFGLIASFAIPIITSLISSLTGS
jgi:hypothetical protein